MEINKIKSGWRAIQSLFFFYLIFFAQLVFSAAPMDGWYAHSAGSSGGRLNSGIWVNANCIGDDGSGFFKTSLKNTWASSPEGAMLRFFECLHSPAETEWNIYVAIPLPYFGTTITDTFITFHVDVETTSKITHMLSNDRINGVLKPILICHDNSFPNTSSPYGEQCPNICQGELKPDPATGECMPNKEVGMSCSEKDQGNPINIAVGNKYQIERDFVGWNNFPFTVTRTYNSLIGDWRFFPEIKIISINSEINVIRIDGKGLRYFKENSSWISEPDVARELTVTEDAFGNITGWTFTTGNDQVETYDAQGRILSVTDRSGLSHTYSYQLNSITVTHSSGDTLVYNLDGEGRVIGFIDSDNRNYQYSYDADGRLVSVSYPDSTSADTADNPKRIYHYEDSNFPKALTGITDENGNRYATWSYDSEGRAISSEHANGVDRATLTYNADGSTTVTNPLGKQTTYHFTTIHGVRKVTQVEGHPTASCEGANRAYSYDVNGNVISKTDWNGVTTTYTYDLNRNLELTRTEASGTPQARTITTQWHPQFRLPTKVTEPNKITEYTYDAQGRQLSSKVSSVQ